MEKVLLCCVLLLNWRLVYSQLLSTVNNVRLVNHIPYIMEFMETAMKDVEAYGWCNLKIPDHEVEIDENVFDWQVKGHVAFKNGFVTSIQKLDLIQHTLQQVWRFDNTDNTTSVFVQATLRMSDVRLGYDIEVTLEDGSLHHFTGIFRHNTVQFPFAVIYNMFTDEYSATVTMDTLPRSTNKMVFAPATALTQVLSHSYDVTSAADGMASWATQVFQPILLNVALNKVEFPQICYNCNTYEHLSVRMKLCALFCFIFAISVVYGNWTSRVYLEKAQDYFHNMVQETVLRLEQRSFSSLRLQDITQTISQQMYKWHVTGNVTYTNGFLVSIQKMDVTNFQQATSVSTVEGVATTSATISGRLNIRDMKIGYDVIAELEADGNHTFTGTFVHTLLWYIFRISKNLHTREISTTVSLDSLSGGLHRMQYMPANNITEVISRSYVPGNIWNSVGDWGRDVIQPILLDVVQNKIAFPPVCLDCR
ncbi:uncharacterized protein LOC134748491 [Cydia strobilella]|uniref:uncharacterized protein LOC134748491 n=1 Tax=Cydia strobilella TaxID=1100964 RepID=UPI003007B89B